MSSKIKVDQIENTDGVGDVAFTGTGGIKLDTIKSSGGAAAMSIGSGGAITFSAAPTNFGFIKKTVITGATGTVTSSSSYQTIKTYSFTPQSGTVSMLVYFKTTASHRAGAHGWHRLKYDGDILAVQHTYDDAVNDKFTSSDQDVFISTITLPKSGTKNFTYEGANNPSPTVGIGNNSTLTILELGI